MTLVRILIRHLLFLWLLVLSPNSSFAFECGRNRRNSIERNYRIYNEGTARNEYPWKVALFDVSEGQNYFCGGVLIDEITILTAAHCLARSDGRILKPADISILLGAHNIDKKNETGQTVFSAESIYIHDKWNSSSLIFNNDVALIKLKETVQFNEFIQPVRLPTAEILNINNGSVVGWGYYDDDEKMSNYPRKVEVSILNAFKCVKNNRELLDIFDDETMFCAGKENVGVCQGDSGSGFYVENDGKFYVRGIVSSGSGTRCSSMNYFLYSDILSNLEFIKKNIMYEKVAADCSYIWFYKKKYTCIIENLNVNRLNFRIGRINAHHIEGKSDQDVDIIRIQFSKFTYLPTFQNGYLKQKFINAKRLVINGIGGEVPLSFAKTLILPKQIEEFELDFFRSKLSHLPVDFLHGALKLKKFYATSNKIEEISEDFFSKNVELKTINLHSNAFKSLPEGLWEKNLKLSEIDISENRLKSLPPNLLKNLVCLTYFIAGENALVSIPQNFFHNNEKLERVFLFGNKITSLPDNLFDNNMIMNILGIWNNKITSLAPNLIANSLQLEVFDAQENEISDISSHFFDGNQKLKKINLENNKIKFCHQI